jgi:multicomponent Na+:H+ antiporter subunit D
MIKIWNEIFWKPSPETLPEPEPRKDHLVMLPAMILVAVILLISVFVEPVLNVSHDAADGVLYPSRYIDAVLVAEEAQ